MQLNHYAKIREVNWSYQERLK